MVSYVPTSFFSSDMLGEWVDRSEPSENELVDVFLPRRMRLWGGSSAAGTDGDENGAQMEPLYFVVLKFCLEPEGTSEGRERHQPPLLAYEIIWLILTQCFRLSV